MQCIFIKSINLIDYENCYLVFYYLHNRNSRLFCRTVHENSVDWIRGRIRRMDHFYL